MWTILAISAGFGAIVLKSHDFPSNSVAHIVGQAVDGVRVFGSVCCDYCIGGLNPGVGASCSSSRSCGRSAPNGSALTRPRPLRRSCR